MAGYVLTSTATEIAHTVGAYTTTTDLTVTAGHIYLIKGVTIQGKLESTGTSGTGALGLLVSDGAGANFVYQEALVPLISTAYNASTRFCYEFALPKAEIVTALPANIPSSASVYTPSRGESSALWNKTLKAGQILRFSPLDSAGTGWNNSTMNHAVHINITYIDYTI